MAYTTKVLSGRTYWYKDGKRIAAAKVPVNIKSGKKPNGKKPNGKKPVGKRLPSWLKFKKTVTMLQRLK